jgi:hypothetical protein
MALFLHSVKCFQYCGMWVASCAFSVNFFQAYFPYSSSDLLDDHETVSSNLLSCGQVSRFQIISGFLSAGPFDNVNTLASFLVSCCITPDGPSMSEHFISS